MSYRIGAKDGLVHITLGDADPRSTSDSSWSFTGELGPDEAEAIAHDMLLAAYEASTGFKAGMAQYVAVKALVLR